MSLSSYFNKKTAQRKVGTNLSTVKPETTAEKSEVSIKAPEATEKKGTSTNNIAKSTDKKGEDRDRGGIKFDFKIDSSDQKKSEQKSSPFTFGFELDDTNAKTKTRRKRNRRKMKKQNESTTKTDDSDSDGDDEVSLTAMHAFLESAEALALDNSNRPQKCIWSATKLETSTTPQQVRLQETKESNDKTPQTKSKAKAHSIRTPPGFTSNTNKTKGDTDTAIGTLSQHTIKESTTPKKSASTSGMEVSSESKAPGKKKKKKKKPVSSQRQAQLEALEEKRTVQSSTSKKVIKQERTLQFNTSDKGRAMVNHGSLAVHKERSKEKNDDHEDASNAFSFGFTFDSLLKDYL